MAVVEVVAATAAATAGKDKMGRASARPFHSSSHASGGAPLIAAARRTRLEILFDPKKARLTVSAIHRRTNGKAAQRTSA